ncbi:MAG: diguanylate cyclase [Phycisphaerae bacterium]|nr:diguanylate cyclase [Phycisphaerae bacterium]
MQKLPRQPELSLVDAASRPAEKILVIDDDEVTLDLLRLHLTTAGYDVLCANNGLKGLSLLADSSARIVVSDWLMPKMDGLAVCRQIRSMYEGRMVYVIMLTVQNHKDQLMEAFDVGVDDFLCKPFHEGELLARVRAGVRVVHLYDQLSHRQAALTQSNTELCQLNERLKQAATTDDLTRLMNRRQAMLRLSELWAETRRTGLPLSAAIIDVDHFKDINDSHGHLRGDEVLQRIATTLLGALRSSDCLYRLGGEEFLVLFPKQNLDAANACAERCRQAVAAYVFADPGQTTPVTISVGLAEATPAMASYDQLLRGADTALYQAKNQGRNCIRIHAA